MLNKKAISPVIAIVLLMIVIVITIFNYDNWYQNYLSSDLAEIETTTTINDPDAIKIDAIVGNTLYIYNNIKNNLEVTELKIGDNTCNLPSNLSKGLNEIDISSCNANIYGTSKEVKIIAGPKFTTKKVYIHENKMPTSSLCSNVVLLYHFDNDSSVGENNSYIHDWSGNANNAICTNCPVSSTGKYNNAYEYDTNYFEVEHDTSLELSNGSINFWFWAEDSNTVQGLFSKDSNGLGTGGHLTFFIQNNQTRARIQNTTDEIDLYGGSVTTGKWYMFTVTFGSKGLKLYLDGSLVNSDPYDKGLQGNYEPLIIGASSAISGNLVATPVTSYFKGIIDEVAVWNLSLTNEEVQNLYNSDSPLNC